MAGRTPAQIKAKIKELEEQLAEANKQEARRIAGYVLQAKLHELDLSRDEWIALFTGIAREHKAADRNAASPAPALAQATPGETGDGE